MLLAERQPASQVASLHCMNATVRTCTETLQSGDAAQRVATAMASALLACAALPRRMACGSLPAPGRVALLCLLACFDCCYFVQCYAGLVPCDITLVHYRKDKRDQLYRRVPAVPRSPIAHASLNTLYAERFQLEMASYKRTLSLVVYSGRAWCWLHDIASSAT